jgi:hypothetical protein
MCVHRCMYVCTYIHYSIHIHTFSIYYLHSRRAVLVLGVGVAGTQPYTVPQFRDGDTVCTYIHTYILRRTLPTGFSPTREKRGPRCEFVLRIKRSVRRRAEAFFFFLSFLLLLFFSFLSFSHFLLRRALTFPLNGTDFGTRNTPTPNQTGLWR